MKVYKIIWDYFRSISSSSTIVTIIYAILKGKNFNFSFIIYQKNHNHLNKIAIIKNFVMKPCEQVKKVSPILPRRLLFHYRSLLLFFSNIFFFCYTAIIKTIIRNKVYHKSHQCAALEWDTKKYGTNYIT